MGQCCRKGPKDESQSTTMPGNVEGETKTVSTVTDPSGKVTTTTTTRRVISSTSASQPPELSAPLDDKSGVTRARRIVKRTIIRNPDGTEKVVEEVTVEGDPNLLPDSGSYKGKGNSTTVLTTPGGGTPTKSPKSQTPQIGNVQVKTTDKQFREDCLKRHNFHRANHGVPPLKHSDQLTKVAQDWADTLAKKDRFEHRPNNSYGENIYMSWSSDPNKDVSGAAGVDSWYSEIKDYTFGVEPRTLASGHFTQVIWKGSTEVGTARARSATGKILVVCNYSPAGNVIGRFAENVPPPRK